MHACIYCVIDCNNIIYEHYAFMHILIYVFIHRLNDHWYRVIRKRSSLTINKELLIAETEKFIKWIQCGRPNFFYPIPKKLSEELCHRNMKRFFQIPLVPCDSPCVSQIDARQATIKMPTTPMSSRKRKHELTGTTSAPRVPQKRRSVQHTRTNLFPSEDHDSSDYSTVDTWSSSDDGMFTRQWTEEAVEKWRTRPPEPHRSEAIHDLAHELKVRDGRSKQYATLFDWSAFQRQSQNADTVKKMIARRCIQDNVGRRKYEKDLAPYYTVCNVCFIGNLCTSMYL